ncbi:MAG TPA: bifunctional phosphopantothenoylcysteine decarboxylase/phosphopantothenate--cysteine ligase CoaBC [Candidatus Syntrophoarchaeum butanivorans]|uniref:Coenzyme A biosynthesis bifunctional protein CoaBC n=1 Tax=Candidatus Syntropharchaeum butanivorans TaxID=1839936 RepID=A0A7C0WZI4_9EURY|nr:bifunctional phosphopantothenoylcysteine decarboxylase/phosphopantothenate--cysteine ligase CoaBC [Candidatus Syntrophoarchaeum butanivorans]
MDDSRGPHPTLRIKGTKSHSLLGKKIVLGVTGSIAAIKTVELARELIRYGADVYAVMTPSAMEIIHPYTLHYATGHEVITKLMGKIEHVEFLGMEGSADLFLVAPCTANTLGKIACAIGDTTVTTFAITAFGSNIPIVLVPAMHETMYNHPVLKEHVERLKKLGVTIVGPKFEEGKAKFAEIDDIVLAVEHTLSDKTLRGKRVLITSGPTAESIDPIRIITNRSSGRTGVELAKECYRQGADVTIIHNKHLDIMGINEIFVESAREMTEACLRELEKGYDLLISAAAITDYTCEPSSSKIPSGKEELSIILKPTAKLIDEVRAKFPELMIVGFKAETNVTVEELIDRAKQKMRECNIEMIVANDVGKTGMGTEDNEVRIISRGRVKYAKGPKKVIAETIVKEISKLIKTRKEG